MKFKNILIVFIFALSSSFLNAQIALEADSVFQQVTAIPDVVGHNSFTNQILQQRTFRWTRNIVEVPDEWDVAICDENNCYIPTVSTMEVDLGPNATSTLDVHVYPNNNYEGYAFIEMKIEHANDPNINAFTYYVFDSSLTTSNEEVTQFNFSIYPNPSKGLFVVEDEAQVVHSLKVYDLTGKQLMSLEKGQQQWINLSTLKNGNYWIQLMDKNGHMIETKMISKI